MRKLNRTDLFSLEEYAARRVAFRAEILAHKRNRKISLGEHATLLFEDRLTIQYQIQEMLRIERIFEVAGIEDELGAYNPLIPDGSNLKATFLLEYEEADERRQALTKLIGIEDRVWMQVPGFERSYAIADEDMERENDTKTSSVHFLRLEFSPAMVAALQEGADLSIGIDHPNYNTSLDRIPAAVRSSLIADFA